MSTNNRRLQSRTQRNADAASIKQSKHASAKFQVHSVAACLRQQRDAGVALARSKAFGMSANNLRIHAVRTAKVRFRATTQPMVQAGTRS
jgi:hypothetical protein